MMKKHERSMFTLWALGMLLFFGGCQYSNSQEVASNTDEKTTKATDVSEQPAESDGCCGKCTSEQPLKQQDSCCGKCTDGSNSKEEGCCGNCQSESKPAEKTESGCEACGKEKAGDCQCEGEAEPDATRSHVNSNREDRDIFHYLLQNHEKIVRTVTNIEDGVETTTESDDPVIAEKIKEHVDSMHGRIKDVRRLRNWDDLFVKIFEHADEIEMEVKHTEKGVKVVETSNNPEVVKLIQQHAVVVSGFAKYGFEAARKNHPVITKAAEKKGE